jgi:hypothetical protein
MAGNAVRLHRVLRAPPRAVSCGTDLNIVQESLVALAKLVEPEIPG